MYWELDSMDASLTYTYNIIVCRYGLGMRLYGHTLVPVFTYVLLEDHSVILVMESNL